MQMFGGFKELCNALRDPHVRAVIDAFRGQPKGTPGRHLSSDNRRYLTWKHFEKLLPDDVRPTTVERLIGRGVLRRGLILKCARCRQEAWHALGALGETFECNRCHLEQILDRRRWLGEDEPAWCYRMAEVLYQFLEHDGELPLLAVQEMFDASTRPVAHAFELEVVPPGRKRREVDIFSTDGYRLWVGEANKDGRFEAGRLPFLANLAAVLDAYGVVLTTSRSDWPPATLNEARSVLTDPWRRLRMIPNVRTVA